jgi:hypothetical protein
LSFFCKQTNSGKYVMGFSDAETQLERCQPVREHDGYSDFSEVADNIKTREKATPFPD